MHDFANPINALEILQMEKAWKRAIHRDQVAYNSKITSLRFAIAKGDVDGITQNHIWLLNSPRAKRIALAQLLRAGKSIDVWTHPEVKALAETVTLFEPMDESALVFSKEKISKDGFRTIFEFGDRYRIAHRVAANIIETHLVKRNFQYFNVGVPKAITRILDNIDAGQVWLAHLDIKGFYPSFTMDGLKSFLPLPPAVVEAALTGRNMVLKSGSLPMGYPHSSLHLIKEARRGLPQGAASSPIISHLCLSQLMMDVADLEHLVNYADDFHLQAKSKAELEGRIAQLTDAVGSLPGGQFSLSIKSISHASDGIDFLGHRLLLQNGKAVSEPSQTNLTQLVSHLHQMDQSTGVFSGSIGKAVPPGLAQVCADKLATLQSWKAAFQACSAASEAWAFVEGLEFEVKSDLADHGLHVSQLPSPSSKTTPKARKFYYYKWFS